MNCEILAPGNWGDQLIQNVRNQYTHKAAAAPPQTSLCLLCCHGGGAAVSVIPVQQTFKKCTDKDFLNKCL